MQIYCPELPLPCSTQFQQAADAWQRRDYQKTIDILERASQQQPNNSKLFLNIAEAHGLRFDYSKAELWLERAVSIAPDKGEILAEAGRRCHRFNQPGMGNRYFTRAAQHPNVGAWVLVAMAEFQAGHSDTDAALSLLQKALELDAAYPGAVVARARLHRLSGELDSGERLLRALLATTAGENCLNAWYEFGTNLDLQGRYDQAMEAFLRAKALVYPSSLQFAEKLKHVDVDIRETQENVSDRMLNRWLAAGADLEPPRRWALLCGHPRSGTTLLEQVLDAHPEILATDETAILLDEAYPLLSKGSSKNASSAQILDLASLDSLRQARAEYFRFTEAFTGQRIGNRILIDKNPAMDVRIPIVARIFPEASFLVAIRDPRDVCLSCFMLPLPPGHLSALYFSLEATVARYSLIMGFSRAIRARLPSPQMEIRYEDVVLGLEDASRRMLRFLGVEWNPAVLRFDAHAKTKLLRCAIDEAVAKPIFASSVGRWRHYQKYLDPCLEQLKPFIKAFGYD
jgi:Tfp pilus assembly protein PilF